MILLDNVANFLSVKKEFQSKYVVHGPHHSPEQTWLELQSILKSIFSFKFFIYNIMHMLFLQFLNHLITEQYIVLEFKNLSLFFQG